MCGWVQVPEVVSELERLGRQHDVQQRAAAQRQQQGDEQALLPPQERRSPQSGRGPLTRGSVPSNRQAGVSSTAHAGGGGGVHLSVCSKENASIGETSHGGGHSA